jgi:hypothetical protein
MIHPNYKPLIHKPPLQIHYIGALKSVYMILPYIKDCMLLNLGSLHNTTKHIIQYMSALHVQNSCTKSKKWQSLYFAIWKVDCIILVSTTINILLREKKHSTVPVAQHGNSTTTIQHVILLSFLTNLGFSMIQCLTTSYVLFFTYNVTLYGCIVTICTASLTFNNSTFCPPTQCIYVICVDLTTNSDYFPIQH